MLDSPWFLGLAPLLGWCLDAVIRTRVFGPPLVPTWASRATQKLEFVMRTGLGDRPRHAGDVLVLWIMVLVWLAGVALSKGALIFGGSIAQFVVWTGMYFLLISVRRRAGAGAEILRSLAQGRTDLARGWLEHIDSAPADDEVTTLSREAIGRLAAGILESGLMPVFWGVALGPAAGGAAVCVHEVARYARRSAEPGEELWFGALRMERWLSWPISWLAAIVLYLVVRLGGGDRGATLAGYFNFRHERPAERLGHALVHGLGLERYRTPEGIVDPVVPEDIQRGLVLLWATTFLGTVLCSAFSCLVFWLG